MELTEVLKKRRTHKNFDGTPLSTDLINELLDYAMTAPNHRRNEPWRFTVITKDLIPTLWDQLSNTFNEAYPDKDEEFIQTKKENLEKKILKLGALIYVTCLKDASLATERENYAACSCAIQNLMLVATDKKLGSFWNTGSIFSTGAAMEILQINVDKEFFVGAIWLGFPADDPKPPQFQKESKIRYWRPSF